MSNRIFQIKRKI